MEVKGIDISIFRHEDAQGVADLFMDIYGNDYPIKIVYNPAQLIDAFEKMDNIPVIARTEEGLIVGYVAMFRSAPHQRLYEAGQGLVLPDYRNMGIAALMNRYLCETLSKRFNIDAVFGEAVCNHTHMQRAWAEYGPIETAIEVDLMPASAYAKENSAVGRVSTLDMFRTYIPKHHKIYIPPIYSEAMQFIYAAYDDTREFSMTFEKPPAEKQTVLNTEIFDFAGVARIAVNHAGFDFEDVFFKEINELKNRGITVIQMWLRLTCPWVDSIVAVLRNMGFFLGGVLPRWFDDDGLLMQTIVGMPNWDGIKLYSGHAKRILDFVKSDWQKTRE